MVNNHTLLLTTSFTISKYNYPETLNVTSNSVLTQNMLLKETINKNMFFPISRINYFNIKTVHSYYQII